MSGPNPPAAHAPMLGIAFGTLAAFCWAAGFVVAKHGINAGVAPADLALHRFVWTGAALTIFAARLGLRDLGGIGWGRGLVLAALGGPLQALLAYLGYTLVPLGHGVVIQPACAALTGIALASALLGERLPAARVIGAAAIVAGLIVFGAESVTTIGAHGVGGDLMFVGAGVLWASFGIALRGWSIAGPRAAIVVGAISFLLYTPAHGLLFGYERMIAAGWAENLLQAAAQGGLAGALPIYLFARAVMLLGAARSATFPALVPVFAMSLGLLIGEIPTPLQLLGLAIVLAGFRIALRP